MVPRGKTSGVNKHVKYIHSKFMLIDPLGEHPIIVTGSANFSPATTENNDENMLVLHGESARAAVHVYLTEFMRLFDPFDDDAEDPLRFTPGSKDATDAARRRSLPSTPLGRCTSRLAGRTGPTSPGGV